MEYEIENVNFPTIPSYINLEFVPTILHLIMEVPNFKTSGEA